MNHLEIKKFLESFETKKNRIIVIVDFGNVEKWKESLGWRVGILAERLLTQNGLISLKKLFTRMILNIG